MNKKHLFAFVLLLSDRAALKRQESRNCLYVRSAFQGKLEDSQKWQFELIESGKTPTPSKRVSEVLSIVTALAPEN